MAKFWGSRFEGNSDELADKFSFSVRYDYRLAIYDVIGGIAHATMLGKQGIIPQEDADRIVEGLREIGRRIEEGRFSFDLTEEDVHSCIQTALKKKIGRAADRLHTARSRNDLIVLDMKLYCLVEVTVLIDGIARVQKAMVAFAERYQDVIIPAYTHLQSAQLVLLAHHVLAYVEMLERDKSRLFGALKRMDELPLGSCALSGTSLPTDREFLAGELGFHRVSANSMDAVSDRDFLMETLSDLAILGVHCSRVAEDLIIWATSEFRFVEIDGSLCTGSSIMPHKKNPDMLELIRGESATLISNAQRLLTLLKGLPLTYNRDLQLDKPPLFESVEKTKDILGLLAKVFATMTVNKDAIEEKIHHEYFFSVDMMEYLIRKGVTYRQAHDTIGRMMKECVDQGRRIADLSEKELKKYSRFFDPDVKDLLCPARSVQGKQSAGSTNPRLVKQQIQKWKKRFRQKR